MNLKINKSKPILSFGSSPLPRAKKSLGQNFLHDKNIARKIVDVLNIHETDRVVEIGPGPGALTVFIEQANPKQLVLIEKDHFYAFERKRTLSTTKGLLRDVILTDALTMPWSFFTLPFKFIGNLPYNIASPLMWELLSQASGVEKAVFMVQKEVGDRIVAKTGTSAYGALSVWIQSFMHVKMEFVVPPHVFVPKPKVDSAVISFTPLPAQTYSFNSKALNKTLKMCFQMRRKQLGSILRRNGNDMILLDKINISPMLRPENLTPVMFHQLSNILYFANKH